MKYCYIPSYTKVHVLFNTIPHCQSKKTAKKQKGEPDRQQKEYVCYQSRSTRHYPGVYSLVGFYCTTFCLFQNILQRKPFTLGTQREQTEPNWEGPTWIWLIYSLVFVWSERFLLRNFFNRIGVMNAPMGFMVLLIVGHK